MDKRGNTYTPEDRIEILDNIFELIAGGLGVEKACAAAKRPITDDSFYKWIKEDPQQMELYGQATSRRAGALFEEMLEIADAPLGTAKTVPQTGDSIAGTNAKVLPMIGVSALVEPKDEIQLRNLQINTRKFMISRMEPTKYGDSTMLKLADSEGGQLNINAIFQQDLLQMPEEETEDVDYEDVTDQKALRANNSLDSDDLDDLLGF